MDRNTLTTVNRLTLGDRFYKVTDKKKVVYERVKGFVKKTKFRTYGFWAKADNDKEMKAFDGKTKVVYLRTNAVDILDFSHLNNT